MATPTPDSSAHVTAVIGRGINLPVTFANSPQKEQLLDMVQDEQVINQSLYTILMTRMGERYNNPEFGTNIHTMIFEPNDAILFNFLYYDIHTSLTRWEKRITLNELLFITKDNNPDDPDFGGSNGDHLIKILVSYIINKTQVAGSYVFPFTRNAMPMNEVVQGHSVTRLAGPKN